MSDDRNDQDGFGDGQEQRKQGGNPSNDGNLRQQDGGQDELSRDRPDGERDSGEEGLNPDNRAEGQHRRDDPDMNAGK